MDMGLVEAVRTNATHPWHASEIHGERHSRQVAQIGRWLSQVIDGARLADPVVVFAFAVLHDSQRLCDGDDPDHGRRAAKVAKRLRHQGAINLSDAQAKLLAYALKHHNEGRRSDDPTIGTCWDADRLALMRVGLPLSLKHLSTVESRAELVSAITAARVTVSAPDLGWNALDHGSTTMMLYHGTCHERATLEGLREGRSGRGIYFTPTRQIAGDYILRSAIRARPMPDHGFIIKVTFGPGTEFMSHDQGIYGFCLLRPFLGRENFADVEQIKMVDIIRDVQRRHRQAKAAA